MIVGCNKDLRALNGGCPEDTDVSIDDPVMPTVYFVTVGSHLMKSGSWHQNIANSSTRMA